MKLFKSLLVAPATIGLLTTFSTFAGEADLNNISKYSDIENIDLANAFVNDEPNNDSLLAGGEGLVDSDSFDGGFSETTVASFSVDAVLGATDGASSETTSLDYQFNIGLSTSFTGEDSLDIAIDSGSGTASATGGAFGFDTGTSLKVDGVTYSFPVGGATMVVGDATDISATFTGACAYSSFTDYTPDDCGTGNSLGVGNKGVTATLGYAFDSGFSLAGGVSSTATDILGDSADLFGVEAAYSADTYGVAVAYVTDDGGASADTTYWGVNGYYTFDLASLSVGFETSDDGTEKSGYFVGLSFPEVGPGSVNVAAATFNGTDGLFADTDTEYLVYEASYAYPMNDGMTLTPGVFIKEGTTDETGVAVKASFSF